MALKIVHRVSTSPLAFPLAAAAALAMFFISETSYDHAASSLNALGTMSTARNNTQLLWRSLLDAETGQRGYLLSERKEYLKPYDEALKVIPKTLAELNAYYGKDDEGAKLMARITRLSNEKLSELATTMSMKESGNGDAWRELFLSDIGKEKMDGVRTASDELLVLETAKVYEERQSVAATILINRIGVSALTALSLLALFMYLRQSTALDRQRIEQQRVVKAERDRLEMDVRVRTEQLTELARHLQTAREDERSRLARDLHDELGALLTAAKLDAARLKSRLGAALSPEASLRLAHLNETLNSGIALKRRIIEDLRPSSLSNLGLVAALEILTREFAERSNLEIRATLNAVRLPPSSELMAYRLVQEALTNIAKYAKATLIHVSLTSRDGDVEISVRDNGVGFDTGLPRSLAHGLLGMRYRVEAEGGLMTLESAPGKGTTVRANLRESPQESREALPEDGLREKPATA